MGFLVVLELRAFNAIGLAAIFAEDLDLHIMQDGVIVFVLGDLRGVNPIARMAAHGVIEREPARVLRDVHAQSLRQFFQIERVLQLASGEKDNQRRDEQDARSQHERPQPFNGESEGQFLTSIAFPPALCCKPRRFRRCASGSASLRPAECRLLPEALQARRQALRKAFSQFAPQKARRCPGCFFNRRRQLDQLAHILFHMPRRHRIQLDALLQERAHRNRNRCGYAHQPRTHRRRREVHSP